MKNGIWWFLGALVVVIGLLIGSSFLATSRPSPYDGFAQCLKDSGVVFYGAFWCPHCQSTKRMFGSAAKLLPYVECSTSDGQGQQQICKDAGVSSYPTWTFAGTSTRLVGEQTFAQLAAVSGCPLPSAN